MRMTEEDSKTFLLLHRNEIDNKNRIKKISQRIRLQIPSIRTSERTLKRKNIEHQSLNCQNKLSKIETNSEVVLENDGPTSQLMFESESKDEPTSLFEHGQKMTIKKEIVTEQVVSAIDRCNVSSEQAMMIIPPVLAAVGVNLTQTTLSVATINRRRHAHRVTINKSIRRDYNSGGTIVTVHFDEKKIKGREQIQNRLAIAVTSFKGCKLLAIPHIADGQSRTIAQHVFETLKDWNLANDVRGLCFDTTGANTGWKSGSAPLLSTMLPHDVLFFACRHHIAELLLSKIFELTVEKDSKGPTICIFSRFKSWWERNKKNIRFDLKNFEKNSVINDDLLKEHFSEQVRKQLVEFGQMQHKINHARADYKEFADLVLVCLGEQVIGSGQTVQKFKAPGAISRARFMAKAIYSMKMYLFRDQFDLTGKTLSF